MGEIGKIEFGDRSSMLLKFKHGAPNLLTKQKGDNQHVESVLSLVGKWNVLRRSIGYVDDVCFLGINYIRDFLFDFSHDKGFIRDC